MPKHSKNTFSVNGDIISIMRDEWDALALATYREDYYEELTQHTWYLNDGYPYNQSLGGGLHRYMMAKWYGEDVLSDMTARGFVVDHMNNNHMDCCISNLEFLKHNRNVAKGQYFDKEAEYLRQRIAVTMFKDFKTGYYQITIGCNAPICSNDGRFINAIKLLYTTPYSQVVLDAEKILTQYDEERRISLGNLDFCDKRITFSPNIELTEEEQNQAVVMRDGIPYIVIGNGKTFIHSIHYDENWEPPTSNT